MATHAFHVGRRRTCSDVKMEEIVTQRRNTDRWQRVYDRYLADRVYEWRARWHIYRARVLVTAFLVFSVLSIRVYFTMITPLTRALQSESALERELGVSLIAVDTVSRQQFESLSEYDITRCDEVPLDELRRGRTRQHHSLSNVLAINHKLLRDEPLKYVTPQMYRQPAGERVRACVLSLVLDEEIYVDHRDADDTVPHTHIIDMINPIEMRLGDAHAVAPEQVQFRDIMFRAAPLVWIDSEPHLRIRYRDIQGRAHELRLNDRDAHMGRAALALLSRGETVSIWGAPDAVEAGAVPDTAVEPAVTGHVEL